MSTQTIIENTGTACTIATPYNPAFVSDLKAAFGRNARWNADTKTWQVPAVDEAKARELVRKHYGSDGSEPAGPTVTVRWTVQQDEKAERAPLMRYGRPIIAAQGRDSGAFPQAGVVLESGTIKSGGSMRYWETIACAGAVLLVHDVPLALAQADADAVIVSGDAQESERLQARLAELDAERTAILARLDQLQTV